MLTSANINKLYFIRKSVQKKPIMLLASVYVEKLQKYGYSNIFTPDHLSTKDLSRDQQECGNNENIFLGALIILRKNQTGSNRIFCLFLEVQHF